MKFILALLKRPRFIAALSALILVILKKVGLDVSAETVNELLAIVALVLAGAEAGSQARESKARADDS